VVGELYLPGGGLTRRGAGGRSVVAVARGLVFEGSTVFPGGLNGVG